MDLSNHAPIEPSLSAGGVCRQLDHPTFKRELKKTSVEFEAKDFTSCEINFTEYIIPEVGISVVFSGEMNDRIVCHMGYAGKLRGNYYAGMTIQDVVMQPSKTLAIHGFIVVDDVFGAILEYPETYKGSQFDDIDSVSELPVDMQIQAIHVLDSEWWR